MINEEKVKLMTKLAWYEEGKGKKDLVMCKYYRSDYIGLSMIKTTIITTIAYFMLVFIVAIYNLDKLVSDITSMDFMTLGKDAVIYYVIMLMVMLVVSYYFASSNYKKAKKNLKEYNKKLKELHLLQKELNKQKTDNDLGGNNFDNETFGF